MSQTTPKRKLLAAALIGLLATVSVTWAASARAADDAELSSSADVQPVAWQPLTTEQLASLVGPVALYPDDLLAIVLPAATYPLQVVQAARLLEQAKDDPEVTPDPEWDESVVALLNYPDVVSLLNEDLDWTWELGQAVQNQEQELLAAVEQFRQEAHAAGNLPSDERQQVSVAEDHIEIAPADPTVIYVPRYQADVIRTRRYVVYDYYPRPCPVYYYPYPAGYQFANGYFWGVTSAFSIGWQSRHLSLYPRYSYRHPYYGRLYADYHHRYWYPRLAASRHYGDDGRNHWRSHWRRQYEAPHHRVSHREWASRRWATSQSYAQRRQDDRSRIGGADLDRHDDRRDHDGRDGTRNAERPGAGGQRPATTPPAPPARTVNEPRSPRREVIRPPSTPVQHAATRYNGGAPSARSTSPARTTRSVGTTGPVGTTGSVATTGALRTTAPVRVESRTPAAPRSRPDPALVQRTAAASPRAEIRAPGEARTPARREAAAERVRPGAMERGYARGERAGRPR